MKPRIVATVRDAAAFVRVANLRARLAATLRADQQRLILKHADAAAAAPPRQRDADTAELRRKLAERRRR